jgi:multisubunit Na+/H+ antiporter MnhE subunit
MAAGILYLGLFALWLAATATGGWPWPVAAATGAVGVMLALAGGLRLKITDAEAAAPFARLGPVIGLMLSRAPGRWRDALGVAVAALGARAKAPVFVRLKLRPTDPLGSAAVVAAMSASPGLVVVDADPGSLLAHALREPDVDVAAMQSLERAALGSMGVGP